jgi:polyhydroxyalkanoate synthesis regulator phasin
MMASRAPPPATTAANEPSVPSAERRQIETMADLATLHQTVEQLTAGQEQLTREIAKLQAELRRASTPRTR